MENFRYIMGVVNVGFAGLMLAAFILHQNPLDLALSGWNAGAAYLCLRRG
jgi:hypothetical protein